MISGGYPAGAGPRPGRTTTSCVKSTPSTTCSTTTASLQINVAVLLLRRNNHETSAAEAEGGLSADDEAEMKSNVLDAVRRFRRAISLTSPEGHAASSESCSAGKESDDRGLVWYHRRLLAGEKSGGIGGLGGTGSAVGDHLPAHQHHAHHNSQLHSHLHGSIRSMPQQQYSSSRLMTVNDEDENSIQSHQFLDAEQSMQAAAYGGCAGATAVLGTPLQSPKKKLSIAAISGGIGDLTLGSKPIENSAVNVAEYNVNIRSEGSKISRRRDLYSRKRSESFPAHGLSSARSRNVVSGRNDTSSANFFGLPPAPPLFDSSDRGAETLAETARASDVNLSVGTGGSRRRRERSESFFLPQSSPTRTTPASGHESFSCSPPSPTQYMTRPRAKSFALPVPAPPPLRAATLGASTTLQPSVELSVDNPMRIQQYREIRERTRRESIVANVVTQTTYHAPVADEVTPLGLEFIGEYVSVVLPQSNASGGGLKGRGKGGEWAQAVRKNLRSPDAVKDYEEEEKSANNADIAASARINLATVLYYGFIGAQDFHSDCHSTKPAAGSATDGNCYLEEEKKEVSGADESDGSDDDDADDGACDEDKRLELAQDLLLKAAEEASSPVLKTVANVNAGVVMFRRNKIKDAYATFKSAKECMDSTNQSVEQCNKLLEVPHSTYLRFGTLLNVATLAVRLNDLAIAEEAVNEIDGGGMTPSASAGAYRAPRGGLGDSRSGTGTRPQFTKPPPSHVRRRIRWLQSISAHHIRSLIQLKRRPVPCGAKSDSAYRTKPVTILEGYNILLAVGRKELGHSHPVVGLILYHRAEAMFNKQQLHPAMLSYLAALKIMECHTGTPDPFRRSDRLIYSRIWYGIGRTLHDREEYSDALRAYQRTLELQTSLTGGSDVCINIVQTLCNVGRVRHALGDIDGALEVHRRVVRIATVLTGGRSGHPFVAARLRALGNLLVEAGRPAEAVRAYAEAARGTGDVCVGFQETEDVDGTESARQSARILARAGLAPPCAATA